MTQPASWWRFPNAPETIAKLIEGDLAGAGKAGTRTPEDLTGVMPFVRVTRIGGSDDGVSDYARLVVEVLGDNLRAVEVLAERIRQHLAGTGAKLRYGPAVIDRIGVDSSPREMPLWAPGIHRYEARYTVVFRRYRVTA